MKGTTSGQTALRPHAPEIDVPASGQADPPPAHLVVDHALIVTALLCQAKVVQIVGTLRTGQRRRAAERNGPMCTNSAPQCREAASTASAGLLTFAWLP